VSGLARPVVPEPTPWPVRVAVWAFASFAFAYFFSALLRGVTATLAPVFSAELGLTAGDLGLLSGAYFLGFAVTQLPLGSALDRLGPRRVLLGFLTLAVLGCAAFALAHTLTWLTLARVLIGVGVSACLMAPMTAYRHGLEPVAQMRANSWMLMTGSLGMVASTLPVQWLLPLLGWRGLFWAVALLVAVSMVGIACSVPKDHASAREPIGSEGPTQERGYAAVWRHPTFIRMAPIGLFHYGGMIAVQSLWAGPWMVQVGGASAAQSAQGLFAINVAMLFAFLGWGLVVPRLYARGWTAQRIIGWGAPVSLVMLLAAVMLGPRAGAGAWALYCVTSTCVSLSQPAVGQAFDRGLAGRALSAYNLMVFAGVFCVQWGIGLAIDRFRAIGWSTLSAFQGAFALLLVSGVASYVWFLVRDDRGALSPRPASA
jgi:predicted MFS family arabinose efflux permease